MKASVIILLFIALIAAVCAIPIQPSHVSAPKGDLIECEVCHAVVYAFDDWLQENKTESFLEVKLEDICKLLGSKGASTCDAIVVAGIPQVIEWVENAETPDEACGPDQLKICDSL
eukprot:TRINITY_DN317_c0_g1_i1.p1 TRINITY_DN317_c0_g1~~TRINITY_DN317_c0_g1_i1.p1  ORF type:complete len:116 (-),score=25.85 TRINITY_DN317_c0_g1_i1:41-388(-)